MRNRLTASQTALAIVIAANVWAVGASCAELTDLVKKANLSGYTRATKPPEFVGRSADGEALSLTSLRGKVVIINFWASWCDECRAEMPAFEQLHHEFAAGGLTVVGINVGERASLVAHYAHDLKLTFPLVLDANGKIKESYGVIGLPTTFVIARDGRAVALAVGPREWNSVGKDLVTALLAE